MKAMCRSDSFYKKPLMELNNMLRCSLRDSAIIWHREMLLALVVARQVIETAGSVLAQTGDHAREGILERCGRRRNLAQADQDDLRQFVCTVLGHFDSLPIDED